MLHPSFFLKSLEGGERGNNCLALEPEEFYRWRTDGKEERLNAGEKALLT